MVQLTLKEENAVKNGIEKNKEALLDIWNKDNLEDEMQYNLEDNTKGFNLYQNNKKLSQLKFSNNKTQEDIVNKSVEMIKSGKKIIFIKGVCGTGKSAIALNLAKKLGKASIVTPGKALQMQYQKDYSEEKYILKENHKKLKIKVITGRENHKCIFKSGCSADDHELPCKIEIKEPNFEKLKKYLKKNPKVKDDLELKDIRRISIAPVCPYWSPIINNSINFPLSAKRRQFIGLDSNKFTIYKRREGCKYYDQFNAYIDAEAIIFNSAKYKIETSMNRKPATEIEIIDECDEFLDSFSNVEKINLNYLLNILTNLKIKDEVSNFVADKLTKILIRLLKEKTNANSKQIFKLKETLIYELFILFAENNEFLDDLDENNYCNSVYEVVKKFDGFFDEVYVNFERVERGLVANLVMTNLEKKIEEFVKKNKAIVMMSGTVHSEKVLSDIFGLKNFAVIEAEIINQGRIEIIETGFEIDCKYENFKNKKYSREDYLTALDKAIEKAKKPVLVHINSFEDLPTEQEKEQYILNNAITKQKMIEMQKKYREELVEKFKKKEIPVLFTTKCNRGVDFPKEQCNSIIFTKYPNPDINSLFWKVLHETHPNYYWDFYKDKARREFLQKIYRGVRSHDDHIYILSPDIRVINAIKELNKVQ